METAQTPTKQQLMQSVQQARQNQQSQGQPMTARLQQSTSTSGVDEKKYADEKAAKQEIELKSELNNRTVKKCDDFFAKLSIEAKQQFFKSFSQEGQQVTLRSFYKKLIHMRPKDVEEKLSPTLQVIDYYQQNRKITDIFGKNAGYFKSKYYKDFKIKIDSCEGDPVREADMYKVLSAVLVKLTTATGTKKKNQVKNKIYYSPSKLKELMIYLSDGKLPTSARESRKPADPS